MSDSPGLGEQALNKAVEIGLSTQLDEVKELHVDIHTEAFQLLHGEVEEVTIHGEGLVMQKDLRASVIDMHLNHVAINPLSVAFGKIELTQPTDASTRVVLTEQDINRAFNSEYVRNQLKNQKIQIDGRPMAIALQHVDFHLPGDGKVALNAIILLPETGKTEQIAFSAVPRVMPNGQTVTLEDVHYGDSQEISPELTKALVDQTSELLNLSKFHLDGMTLRVKTLEVKAGKLTLHAEAHIDHIPAA